MMRVSNVTRLSYQVLLLSLYFDFLISTDPRITCVKFQDRDGYGRLARRSIVPEKEAAESSRQIPTAGHGRDTIIGTARDIEPVAATSHSHDSQVSPKLELKLGSVNRLSPKSSQSSAKSAFTSWRSAPPERKRAATPEVTESEGSEARTGKRSKVAGEPEADISVQSFPSDIQPSANLPKFQVFVPQSSSMSEAAKENYGTASPFPLSIIVGEEKGSYHQHDALLELSKETMLTSAFSRNTNPPSTDPSKMMFYEAFVDPISRRKHPIMKPTPKQLTRPIVEETPSPSPDKMTRGERSTSASGNRPIGSSPRGHALPGNLIAGQQPMASQDVLDRIGKEMEKVRIGRGKGVNHLQKAQIARLATAEGYMASIVNFIQKSAPEVQGFMLLRPKITKETRRVYHLLRTNPHVNEKGEYKSLPSHPLFAPIMNLSQEAFKKTQKNLFQAMAAEGRISVPSPQLHRGTSAPAALTASMTSGSQLHHEDSSKSMPPGKFVAENHPQMTHESQDSQTPSLIEAERQGYGHRVETSPGSPKEEDFTEVVNWMGDSHPQIAKDLVALRSGMGSALEQKRAEPNLGETPWTSPSQPSPPTHEHTVQRPPSTTAKILSGKSTTYKSSAPQSQSFHPGLARGASGSPAHPGVQFIRNTEGQIYPVLVTPSQMVNPNAANIALGHQDQLYSQADLGNQIRQRMGSRPVPSMNSPSPSVSPSQQLQSSLPFQLLHWLQENDSKNYRYKKSN